MQIRLCLSNAALMVMAVLGAGCAATNQPPTALDNLTKVENLPGKPGCFWKSSFQGDWTVLNESTLIVHAPLPRDAYVVKLFEPVFSLGFKEALAFEDREHNGQICNNGDDYLVVPGFQPPQVPIVAIHALTPEQEDQLLQVAGKPLPKRHAAAAATPAPAAATAPTPAPAAN
jgi:hypothetical protein